MKDKGENTRYVLKLSLVKLLIPSLLFLTSAAAHAASDRVSPAASYGVHDYVFTEKPFSAGVFYAAGLDVVYARVSNATDGRLTRCFLHVEARDTAETIRVVLHDYKGDYHRTLCEVGLSGVGALPQTVKYDPGTERIWFSYTRFDNSDDRFFAIPWDPQLQSYPLPADFQFRLNGNWEVEWSTDEDHWNNGQGLGQGGRPFFSATGGGWGSPNAIWILDGADVKKVVHVGGNASGFAFDNRGNLWLGTVLYGEEPERLFMWTADDIDAAADSEGALVLAPTGLPGPPEWGPTVMLDLPEVAPGINYVPSDIECDPEGNVYVSNNSALTVPGSVFAHKIVLVRNNGVPPWPQQQDMSTLADAYVVGSDKGFRALSYDGDSSIDGGGVVDPRTDMRSGNRLYVDMDFALGSDNPDEIVGLSTAADTDADTVPESLDNCWQTANPDQADSDVDGLGDLCEGDCDGSGDVDDLDLPCMVEYGDTHCSAEYICSQDLDGDGDVDGSDLALFAANLVQIP